MRTLLLFFILLVAALSLDAAIIELTTSGAGSGDGTSLGNAMSVATHNAGTFSPGDTIVINGTVSEQIRPPSSGAVGNPIKYHFAAGAKMSAPYWPAGEGAIEIVGKHNITVDGMATGQIGGWAGNEAGVNGIVECTDNGTSGYYTNSVYCGGVHGINCNNLTVKNLKVTNIYRRVKNASNEGGGSCIENSLTGTGYSNFVVDNCIVDNASIGVLASFAANHIATGFSFTNITATKCNWCISVGGNDTGAKIDGITVSGCKLGDMINWDDESGTNAWHHNGFCFFPQDDSSVPGYGINIRIHNNRFIGPYGSRATSAIYMNGNDWMDADAWIYNNVFLALDNDFPTNGLVTVAMNSGTVRTMNNTFISAAGGGDAIQYSGAQGGTNPKNFYSYNNFTYNCCAVMFKNMVGTGSTMYSDYNSASGVCSGSGGNQYFGYSDNQNTFAIWQANGLGLDQHSNINTATVDANYVPQVSDTALRNLGMDLRAYFTTDFSGAARTVPFDIGAYEYSNNSITTTNLTVTTLVIQ